MLLIRAMLMRWYLDDDLMIPSWCHCILGCGGSRLLEIQPHMRLQSQSGFLTLTFVRPGESGGKIGLLSYGERKMQELTFTNQVFIC